MSSLDDDSLMVFLINYEKPYSFGKVQSFCIKYLQFCSIKITSEWSLTSVNRIEIYLNYVQLVLVSLQLHSLPQLMDLKIILLYIRRSHQKKEQNMIQRATHFSFISFISFLQLQSQRKVNVFWRFPKTHLSRVAAKRRCSNTLQGLSRIFTLENIKFKVVCIVHRRRENCF